MAKYIGTIGYVKTVEVRPGVFLPQDTERPVTGNIVTEVRRFDGGGTKVNDDISLGHRISIIADKFAFENFAYIKYATYMDTKWKVQTVEIQRPRIILSLSGVYNG